MTELLTVFVFAMLAVMFVFANLSVSRMIAPHNSGPVKNSSYECGEPAQGTGWANYGIRFQNYALAFIIFDVELALVFPVARIFRESLNKDFGSPVFFSLLAFLIILFLGLLYIWRSGDLDWNREGRATRSKP